MKPNPNNIELLLNDLKAGKPVSALDAFSRYRLSNLRDAVYKLRKQGYKIQSQTHYYPEHGKRFAVYTMGGAA